MMRHPGAGENKKPQPPWGQERKLELQEGCQTVSVVFRRGTQPPPTNSPASSVPEAQAHLSALPHSLLTLQVCWWGGLPLADGKPEKKGV
jgi:hypothetical protein